MGSKKSLDSSVTLGKGGNNAEISVVMCNQNADIKVIANKKIQFYVPACDTTGLTNITVTDGTHSDSNLTFNYTLSPNAPRIIGVYPHSSNPKLKTTVEIHGSNFGTNVSAVRAFLTNSQGQAYELRVLTVEDGKVQCGLPGGKEGQYSVQLTFDGVGDAVIISPEMGHFSYSFQIDSVSPSEGSFYGGTLLTIVG